MLKYIEDAPNCAFVESEHIRGYLVHNEDKTVWWLFANAKEYYCEGKAIKRFDHDGSDDFEEHVVDRWLEQGDTPIFFDRSIEHCGTETGVLAQDPEDGWTWTCSTTGSDIVSNNRTWLIKTLRALGEIE
jgi:hypothetical protein